MTGSLPSMTAGQPNPEESVADRLIREAMDSGEFDDLPGAGKPIPGAGTPDGEGWWIKKWVERNRDSEKESSGDSGTPHSGTSDRL